MNIAQEILQIKSTLNEVNRGIFIAQASKIDASVSYAIRRVEFRESKDILELDVLAIELDLIYQSITEIEQELVKFRLNFDNLLETLENF